MQQWDDKWDYLQIILEVYQFARDSDAAEAWLLAQDAYIGNQDLGENLDAVENLIKRHETFEKAAFAQEDRFLALERLTTLELREKQKEDGTLESKASVRDQYIEDFTPPEEERDELEPQHVVETEAASPAPVQEEVEPVQAAATQESAPPQAEDPVDVMNQSSTTSSSDQPDAALDSSRLSAVSEPSAAAAQSTGDAQEKVRLEGPIQRKHEWENTGTKASHRTWDKLFAILNDTSVSFYKDQKQAKTAPQSRVRGEKAIPLGGAVCEVPTDYSKRPHVFRLNLPNGGQYLLQCKSDDEMKSWLRELENITGNQVTESAASKSQTMPAKSSTKKEDSAKKKGKFTLKKKN